MIQSVLSSKIEEYCTNNERIQTLRIRLLLRTDCGVECQIQSIPSTSDNEIKTVTVSKLAVNTNSPFVLNKTTHRDIYDYAKHSSNKDVFDIILRNSEDQITETTIANVAIQSTALSEDKNMALITPPTSSGLLDGTMRQFLLNESKLCEKIISVKDIRNAKDQGLKIYCFNSVRELYQELQQTKSVAVRNRTSDLPDSSRPYEPKGYNVKLFS
ncbi:hypothetical protein BB560_006141 [Smittium megazygosporum]|uniref:Uncharacterized protein n=1 Tax=Smittium megazygosporum TaxID=133381 RepID=A0A2T9YFW3_9FUNG|nr:hypothetical protein BB560_006141 [Smittium megazygosporum]